MERIKRALILVQSHGAVSGDDGYRAQCSREVTGGSLSWCENSQLNCERLGHFSSRTFSSERNTSCRLQTCGEEMIAEHRGDGSGGNCCRGNISSVVLGIFWATTHFKNSKSDQAFCLIFIYILWFHGVTVYCITDVLLIDIITFKGIKTGLFLALL